MKCTVTFDRYVAVHGAANSLAYAVDADVTLYGPAALCADDAVASLPSSQVVDAVDHLGFGMGSVAYPALTPTSGWGYTIHSGMFSRSFGGYTVKEHTRHTDNIDTTNCLLHLA